MQLRHLLDGVEVLDVSGDPATVDVTAVTHDSRAVVPGALFCCVPGSVVDGHDFGVAAVDAGAVALLVERRLGVDGRAVQVVVGDVRSTMASVAAAFWGAPSRAMSVVGVTGTNGKTTVTALLQSVLSAAGRRCEVIGTLTGARTTPESTELQAQLAAFRDDGVDAVAMEVSSHALELHRVDATWFSVAVFTNLGRDHLDFHGTEEAYFRAKARLFEPERCGRAVVNRDDAHGRLLLDAARVPTVAYSLDDASDVSVGAAGSTFTWAGEHVELRLGGTFNVSNALAAAAVARELGVDAATIAAGLASAPAVPGRFEAVDAGQAFPVVVDYAHTPDGLEQVLRAARGAVAPGDGGRVLVVFGCGGDRDRSKRPVMGDVAVRLADRAWLTSDNPRSEDPMAIIDEVLTGVRDADRDRLVVEPDRRAAIASAVRDARAGDVVVIAGKGHETGQIVGEVTLPFDDRVVAREVLTGLGS
ncbi:MAG TPA: UDP-N-acetylmuramoyl-L-alanyl-D-glutamate--2,6-diaminopimelate ligase [Acidimicrobiales bacterium]|nr:UDP-N-acetylmuramoyl-L-alanyl-D-glutamate--2,6-diaminopimelate ligase [Acidimicrobiales bacterium]